MFRMGLFVTLALASIGSDAIPRAIKQEHDNPAVTVPDTTPGLKDQGVSEQKSPAALELSLPSVSVQDSISATNVKLPGDVKPRSILQQPEDGPAVRTENINGVESAFTPTQQTGFPNPGFRNNLPRPERGVAAQIFNRISRGSARHIAKPKEDNQQDLTENHDHTKHITKSEFDVPKYTISLKSDRTNSVKKETNKHIEISASNVLDSRIASENKRVAIIRTSIPISLENLENISKDSEKNKNIDMKKGRQLWSYLEPIPLKLYNVFPSVYSLQELVQILQPLDIFPPTFVEYVDNSVPLQTFKLQTTGDNAASSDNSVKSVGNSSPSNGNSLQSIDNSTPFNAISLKSADITFQPSISLQSIGNSLPVNIITLKSVRDYLPFIGNSLQSLGHSMPVNTISLKSVGDSLQSNGITIQSIDAIPLNTIKLKPITDSSPLNGIPLKTAGNYLPLDAVSLKSVPLITNVNIQHQNEDKLGNYEYGYSNRLSAKYESRSLDGVTRGAYSYVDPNGILQSVNYEADNLNGFRVMATNLPLAPKL